MNIRSAVAPLALTSLLLVAAVGGSAPAAHRDPEPRSLDLLASAHPTSAEPAVSEVAFDAVRAQGREIAADTAALTSTTCDRCTGESSALHVVYVPRGHEVRLDNVATAWAQGCQGCTSTALSVQVVVLRGRPVAVPNNRALALNAACDGCRTSALAFQVVLIADRATPLSADALAELRAWFDEQSALLRASVISPDPAAEPTLVPETPSPTEPRAAPRAKRDPTFALGELEQLLVSDLDAETLSADIEVSR